MLDQPRILVTRTDRIGDLVISTPIFRALREKFPHSHIAVCVFQEHRELVEGNPHLSEVILYDKAGGEKHWPRQFCFAQKIRRKKFDCVIHLHATNRMHLMGWLAGIPVRVGYDRRAAWALTQAHAYDKKEGARHEADYLFRLVSELATQPTFPLQPYVPVSEKNRRSLENLLEYYGVSDKNIAVIHPSASDATKMWPADGFAQLIRHSCESRNLGISFRWIAIGDDKASEQAQKIQELSGIPLINFCGKLSLGMLAALFEKSGIVVSNDSGPAHIAAAVGAPTVSIFGRWQAGLNVERWRPLGAKTAVVIPQIDNILPEQRKFSYIEEISVEQVFAAAQQVLA